MRLTFVLAFFLAGWVFTGCDVAESEKKDPSNGNDTENQSWIRLEHASDHSGILVEVLEHAAYAMTDENGYFSFEDLPNGNYTIAAEFPYHTFYQSSERGVRFRDGKPDRPLEETLSQQASFYAELDQTVINLQNRHENEPFFLPRHDLIVENLTNDYVTFQSNRGPFFLHTFEPVSGSWPTQEDVGIPCELQYGTFGSDVPGPAQNEMLDPQKAYRYEIEPEFFSEMMLNMACFPAGDYDVYISISNQIPHSRFFNPEFPFDMDPQQGMDIYINPLSQSLFGKNQIIEPVRITIVR